MRSISKNASTIFISDEGCIVKWNNNNHIFSPCVYPVFFRDYSRTDPFCRLWDISSKIEVINSADNFVQYIKKIENVELRCDIHVSENGWDWEITVKEPYPLHHRFGLAIPCLPGQPRSIEKIIKTPVMQYYRSSHEVFRDQTFLELPIIMFGNNDIFTMYTSMSTDCQFFHYIDGENPYIRVTSSTSISDNLLVSTRINNTEQEAKLDYIGTYPQSDVYINKWKPLVSSISKRQNIDVVYQHDPVIISQDDYKIHIEPLIESELNKSVCILSEEIQKYPTGFLKSIGIDGIMLCGTIIIESDKRPHFKVNGFSGSKNNKSMAWIYYDTSCCNRWVIHHEIFHFMRDQLQIPYWPDGTTIFSLSGNDLTEQQADCFALLMTDTENLDPRIKILKSSISSFNSELIPKTISKESDQFIWAMKDKAKQKIRFGDIPDGYENWDFATEVENRC